MSEGVVDHQVVDVQYLATPFYGSRRMTAELSQAGRRVNRKHVQRLMRLMGLEALGRPHTVGLQHPGKPPSAARPRAPHPAPASRGRR